MKEIKHKNMPPNDLLTLLFYFILISHESTMYQFTPLSLNTLFLWADQEKKGRGKGSLFVRPPSAVIIPFLEMVSDFLTPLSWPVLPLTPGTLIPPCLTPSGRFFVKKNFLVFLLKSLCLIRRNFILFLSSPSCFSSPSPAFFCVSSCWTA